MAAWAGGAVMLGLVGLQTMTVSQLRGEVTELSSRVQAVESGEAAATVNGSAPAVRRMMARPVRAPQMGGDAQALQGTARSVDEGSESAASPELEALVHRTLEQQTREREAEQTARWMDRASRWTERRVDGLVEEGLVGEDQAEAVITMLVNEMHDGMEIKETVQAGEMTEEQGWERWGEMRRVNDEALTEMVGEEATKRLREDGRGGK